MTDDMLLSALNRIERTLESHSTFLAAMGTERALAHERTVVIEKRLSTLEASKWTRLVSLGRDVLVIASVVALASKQLGF